MPPRRVKKGFGQHDTRYGSGILKFSEVEIRDNVSGKYISNVVCL